MLAVPGAECGIVYRRPEVAEGFCRERTEHEVANEAEQTLNVGERDKHEARTCASACLGARSIRGRCKRRKQTRHEHRPAYPGVEKQDEAIHDGNVSCDPVLRLYRAARVGHRPFGGLHLLGRARQCRASLRLGRPGTIDRGFGAMELRLRAALVGLFTRMPLARFAFGAPRGLPARLMADKTYGFLLR